MNVTTSKFRVSHNVDQGALLRALHLVKGLKFPVSQILHSDCHDFLQQISDRLQDEDPQREKLEAPKPIGDGAMLYGLPVLFKDWMPTNFIAMADQHGRILHLFDLSGNETA